MDVCLGQCEIALYVNSVFRIGKLMLRYCREIYNVLEPAVRISIT